MNLRKYRRPLGIVLLIVAAAPVLFLIIAGNLWAWDIHYQNMTGDWWANRILIAFLDLSACGLAGLLCLME